MNPLLPLIFTALLASAWGQPARRGRAPAAEPSAAADAEESASLSFFGGFVELGKAGSKEWEEVTRTPRALHAWDRVHTYIESKAVVAFHEESSITLGAFSILSLERLAFAHVVSRLELGSARVKVTWRSRRRFELRTPEAMVIVTGTNLAGNEGLPEVGKPWAVFTVARASVGRTRVEVHQGAVTVRAPRGGEVVLSAREKVEVADGVLGKPTPFVPADAPAAGVKESP